LPIFIFGGFWFIELNMIDSFLILMCLSNFSYKIYSFLRSHIYDFLSLLFVGVLKFLLRCWLRGAGLL
jgi:hypothetical protein